MILEQVVSRHDPAFDVAGAQLGLGLDGLVYLTSGGRVLRVGPDGTGPRLGQVGYSAIAVTAGAQGMIVTAETHFPHRVAFWDRDFAPLAHLDSFTDDDTVGWAAPSAVEAGTSGDFYALDQYEKRVVRLNRGGVVAVHPLTGITASARNYTGGLRVSEARSRIYTAWQSGGIWATAFDGSPLWNIPVRPAGLLLAAFDIADDGTLYVLTAGAEVQLYDGTGTRSGTLTLALPDSRYPVNTLRLRGNEVYVRRDDPATLFEVYDRTTGGLLRRVGADVERLTVTIPGDVWTAGQPVPLTVAHDRGRWPGAPRLRVWLRPLGVPEFTELPLSAGQVTPPAGARGLYQLRVSPDVRGRYSQYVVDGVVEIRAPGATGTVSILTELNRFSFGRGEPVPVTVLARGTAPATVRLQVLGGGKPVATADVTLRSGRGEASFDTASWPAGRYVVDADVPGATVAPQHLDVGAGLATRPEFHVVQHGDYSDGFPADPRTASGLPPRVADVPDVLQAHVARAKKLGLNLFVDRLGWAWQGRFQQHSADAATAARLAADPVAVAPEKAVFEDPSRRAIAAYGAHGIEEQAILLSMDAGLPLGKPYDTRTPEQMEADVEAVTGLLKRYPAFRGWSWAANWWLTKTGADMAADDTEKAAYAAALAAAKATGAWDSVLDTVAARTFALKVDAEARFRAAADAADPGKVSAMTGPYRAIQSPPQVLFAHADEVDLQFQAEQIQPPQVTGHEVDFQRRPGKPVWGHPELWNDDGTGGMFAPTVLQQVMRGADGTGMVGDAGARHVPPHAVANERTGGLGARPGDPWSGGAGKTSMLRALFELAAKYGPLTAGAASGNRVAIVVSRRMQCIEEWDAQIWSSYFAAQFEAYNACLYAHRPASFVFTDDVSADVLRAFDAVLLVGQRVELDPPLAEALRAAGVPVYHDGSCRPEVVDGFTPLGLTFDRVRQDPSVFQDDSAYPRLQGYFLDHAAGLRKVLDGVKPVAECDQPEVLLSDWTAGGVRYVWAVNNTMLDWDPGDAWRVGLFMTARVPVLAELTLDVPLLHQVVDVLTGKAVTLLGGRFTADLRTAPARLYAVVTIVHGAVAPALPDAFGPHVRDIAVTADGRDALLNCFAWDHNAYGLDPATGKTRWRRKLGHHFATAPSVHSGGFAVRGFDLDTAEGHHLYLLDAAGVPRRRFALFGLPKRATDWAQGEWAYDAGMPNFAVAPDGSWVATAGDLGLVVWDAAGNQRWSAEWWADDRTPLRLLALDDSVLLGYRANTITGFTVADGRQAFSIQVPDAGWFGGGAVSGDRRTAVLWSDGEGGRLFVVRGGALVNTIPAPAEEVSVSPGGDRIAVTAGRKLSVFDTGAGLLWTFTGDDFLRRPRISADGARVAVGSELGTLTVLSGDGAVLAERDLRALPVPAWLPGGDLLVATWMGTVVRYDGAFAEKWRTRLTPAETDARAKLRLPDPTPTTRKTGWGNAVHPPLPLVPNLLTETSALITAESVRPEQVLESRHSAELLRDGKVDPPPGPWLHWHEIGYIDSGWRDDLVLKFDAFRTQLRLTGVTLAEDPAHPSSWLRDLRVQWWDAETERWQDGPLLLSDEPLHSHVFDQPLEAARFRFVTTGGGSWPGGNIRLGEVAFHGEQLGASHRDVLARRARATLFDDRVGDLAAMLYFPAFGFHQGDAYSGSTCLELSGAGEAHPFYRAPFGHAIPDWDFTIAENPRPGQYRWLQFAWTATSPATTGIGLRLGHPWPGPAYCAFVGDSDWPDYSVLAEHRVAGPPPAGWTKVRVDLWALSGGQPGPIRGFGLRAEGGGARFDQLVLGRTEADLP